MLRVGVVVILFVCFMLRACVLQTAFFEPEKPSMKAVCVVYLSFDVRMRHNCFCSLKLPTLLFVSSP